MRYSKWKYLSKYPEDILKAIVKNRSITKLDEFLNIDYRNLVSTKKLKNIDKAVLRIKRAVEKKLKIGIFCDYDADGVCSGAIIYRAISLFGGQALTYVPERKEGYSLNQEAIKYFISEKVDLVITLDCGIKSHREILMLKDAGIETIIVDHHQLPDELPEAYAIVHPDITSDLSSLELSGGGTAYMVARELLGESGQEKWLIDLAAISSVADIVPLNHDNRILVKYGMQVLAKTKNIGLKNILEISSLGSKPLTTYDLGFAIAPRLNAAGRIAHPRDSYELLVTNDSNQAAALAKKLDKYNSLRQDMLSKSVDEAIKYVESHQLGSQNIIVITGDWDEGIVGLIASKITDKYYRPSIVLSSSGEFLKGSARSIQGVNITDMLASSEEILISFGGHSQAAGLSLEKSQLKLFMKKIADASSKINKNLFARELVIDALIKHEDLTIKNIEKLEKLSPFGPGNTKPVLALEKVAISQIETIGRDHSHQKVYFDCGGREGCFLVFSFEKKNYGLKRGRKFDIAFTAGINEFRGSRKVDLFLEDAKESA